MPPDRPLADDVQADFVAWIKAGADWPKASRPFPTQRHWAFEPVKAEAPPADPDGWSDHPIDRFIAERLPRKG